MSGVLGEPLAVDSHCAIAPGALREKSRHPTRLMTPGSSLVSFIFLSSRMPFSVPRIRPNRTWDERHDCETPDNGVFRRIVLRRRRKGGAAPAIRPKNSQDSSPRFFYCCSNLIFLFVFFLLYSALLSWRQLAGAFAFVRTRLLCVPLFEVSFLPAADAFVT